MLSCYLSTLSFSLFQIEIKRIEKEIVIEDDHPSGAVAEVGNKVGDNALLLIV